MRNKRSDVQLTTKRGDEAQRVQRLVHKMEKELLRGELEIEGLKEGGRTLDRQRECLVREC